MLFEAGKFAISLYIAKQGLELTYGAAASFVVLLVWVYYSSQIMLFGAELTHVYALRRKVAGRARMPSAVSPLPEERAVTRGHPLPRGSGTEQRPVAPRSLAGADMLDEKTVAKVAEHHGISMAAVNEIAAAIKKGGGRSAQFNHPELGGMGQWMANGMLMIGEMFNNSLKAKVAAICRDVAAELPRPSGAEVANQATDINSWWPPNFGRPSSVGSQNDMRYAVFPESRRLVVEQHGALSIYDLGEYEISGAAQQQRSSQTLTFSGARGVVPLERLRRIA